MQAPENPGFSHVRDGLPAMVDVAGKSADKRTAVAEVRVELGEEIIGSRCRFVSEITLQAIMIYARLLNKNAGAMGSFLDRFNKRES